MLNVLLLPVITQDTEHSTSPPKGNIEIGTPFKDLCSVEATAGYLSFFREYRIQFAHCPLCFNGMVPTTVKLEQVHLLSQELQSLLGKGAIQSVLSGSQKNGGLHPILDLHSLNCSLRTFKFKILTIKMIVTNLTS